MIKRSKLSALLALTLTASMVLGACGGTQTGGNDTEKGSESSGSEYIAAPYTIDDEKKGPTEYLEPVFYENEDGPTIGVTLVGVIKQDGKYFKDSDNDKELDVFEDWTKEVDTRIADLLTKVTTEQQIGLLQNQLMCSPTAKSAEEVYDEDGKVILSQLLVVSEDALNATTDEGMASYNSTGHIITNENRSGVYRSNLADTELGALWTNAIGMTTEYAAVAKNEPTIPFTILSNPIDKLAGGASYGLPTIESGLAAAAMGDGNYDLVKKYADTDRQLWDAMGISRMYGPQIDLITDPRWSRNNTTYTEVPEVMAGIADALVQGYQTGTDGAQDGDVALIMKHFPGDGSSYNGFESHVIAGQWRVYPTAGSLEKYQMAGFEAAINAGLAGIMPAYSMQAGEGTLGSVKQTYKGVEIAPEEISNAFNKTILQTLLRDTMEFEGFINTDSGIITRGCGDFGVDPSLTGAQKVAASIAAGADVIGDNFDGLHMEFYQEAVNDKLISDEDLDRANGNILKASMQMGQFENPYKDVAESKATGTTASEEILKLGEEISKKSVVLMKNHDNVLPLKDTAKKVYVASFTEKGEDEATITAWTEAFEKAGFTVVDKAEEADIAFMSVVPSIGSMNNPYVNSVDLVDGLEVDELDSKTGEPTGAKTEITTVKDVDEIKEIADAVHANGGKVIGSVQISNPWILTNLEPYCDGLIGEFGTPVAAQMAVLTGEYNPTGKLPMTMVSCNEVIAIDANGLCVSPNDVPGYDKDQYISADVLAQSPSGSYAYKDADGNVYEAWFGLSY